MLNRRKPTLSEHEIVMWLWKPLDHLQLQSHVTGSGSGYINESSPRPCPPPYPAHFVHFIHQRKFYWCHYQLCPSPANRIFPIRDSLTKIKIKFSLYWLFMGVSSVLWEQSPVRAGRTVADQNWKQSRVWLLAAGPGAVFIACRQLVLVRWPGLTWRAGDLWQSLLHCV